LDGNGWQFSFLLLQTMWYKYDSYYLKYYLIVVLVNSALTWQYYCSQLYIVLYPIRPLIIFVFACARVCVCVYELYIQIRFHCLCSCSYLVIYLFYFPAIQFCCQSTLTNAFECFVCTAAIVLVRTGNFCDDKYLSSDWWHANLLCKKHVLYWSSVINFRCKVL